MQVFTSVAVNYLPKARVLADSVKRFHPDACFHLLLCDAVPAELRASQHPFDTITQVEELPIDNVRQWIFKHTLVELCTAVKGTFCQKLLAEHPGEAVFYLDPDIVVLGSLDPLLESLRAGDALVTPHQTEPNATPEGIMDNELSALRHGAFNLGFLGVAPTAEGRRFADWWGSGCGASAGPKSRTACSPISAGSIWPPPSFPRCRFIAIRAATWPPGT